MSPKIGISLFAIGIAGGVLGAFLFQSLASQDSTIAYQKYVSTPLTEISSYTLLQRMAQNDTSFLIIDARDKASYNMGHIKGAISFTPTDLQDSRKLASLPKDKDMVIYCWSSECMLGPTLSSMLAQAGFTNIKELRIGWCEWSERGYPIDGKRYIVEGECLVPQRSINNEAVGIINPASNQGSLPKQSCAANSTNC